MVTPLQWWWRQPDHFDWLVTYLRVRRMSAMTRAVLVVVTSCLAFASLVVLFGSSPPSKPFGMALSVVAGAGAAAGAVLWLVRFPTKNQSIAFAVVSSTSIALAVLAQGDPMSAILACTAFASISGYIALFHTAPLMIANLIVILTVSAVPAVHLFQQYGAVRAASAYAVMLVVNVAVPYGVQIIVHTLGVDLLKADRDPLTGLFNRRAFYRRTAGLASAGDGHLVIAMIDLDRFKRLNDTRGHTEGDLALSAVGRVLRDTTPRGAIIGRAGGEEFLVAIAFLGADPDAAADELGRRVCQAIEDMPFDVTASVGSACAPLTRLSGDGPQAVITALVATADAAMYEAKRSGGNQTRHHRQALGPTARTWSRAAQRWEVLPARPEHQDPDAVTDRLRGRDWSAWW